MKHKSLQDTACPIARGLERVGEWWSMLIIREAFYGARKFDEFQQGVEGISPATLTRRLNELVDSGILERRPSPERPDRLEYALTQCGREFLPVLWAMLEWGNKFFCPEGDIVRIANTRTNNFAALRLVDQITGEEVVATQSRIVPGPGATPAWREKISSSLQTDR